MALALVQGHPVSFAEVVRAWLDAELASPRRSALYRSAGYAEMPESPALQVRALFSVRRPLLEGLPLDSIEWVRVPVDLSALKASYYLRIPAGWHESRRHRRPALPVQRRGQCARGGHDPSD